MNFGRGVPIPQQNGIGEIVDPLWNPVNTVMPITQGSNSSEVQVQGGEAGGENWRELLGIYSEFLMETPESSVPVLDFNLGQDVGNQGNLGQIGGNLRNVGLSGGNMMDPGQNGGNLWSESHVEANWMSSGPYEVNPPNAGQNVGSFMNSVRNGEYLRNEGLNGGDLISRGEKSRHLTNAGLHGGNEMQLHQNSVNLSNADINRGRLMNMRQSNGNLCNAGPNIGNLMIQGQIGENMRNAGLNGGNVMNLRQSQGNIFNAGRNVGNLMYPGENGVNQWNMGLSIRNQRNPCLSEGLQRSPTINRGNLTNPRPNEENLRKTILSGGNQSYAGPGEVNQRNATPNRGYERNPDPNERSQRNLVISRNINAAREAFGNGHPNSSINNMVRLLQSRRNATLRAAANANANGILAMNRPAIQNPSTILGTNWTGLEPADFMIGKQNQTLNSADGYNSKQFPTDEVAVPCRPYYNLNSPPRSEADASSGITNPFQFAPVTPVQQKPSSEQPKFSIGESSTQENGPGENLVIVISDEKDDNDNQQLQNAVDSSSSAISTTQKDHNDQGGEVIDLNKTPPQKTPKRRKHRPKVVKEGKPKKTTTPKAPNEGSPGKRKYVRQIGQERSETEQANCVGQVCAEGSQNVQKRKYVRKKSIQVSSDHQAGGIEIETSPPKSAAKSCRRALNFELDNQKGSDKGFNLNLIPQETEQPTGINSVNCTSLGQIEQQSGHLAGISDLRRYGQHSQGGSAYLPEDSVPSIFAGNDLNNVTTRNSVPVQNRWQNSYTGANQHVIGKGLSTQVDNARLMSGSTSAALNEDLRDFAGNRGVKRQFSVHPCSVNEIGSPHLHHKTWPSFEPKTFSEKFGSNCQETCKKMKMHNGFNANTAISCVAAVLDNPRQEKTRWNDVYRSNSVSQPSPDYFGRNNTSNMVINSVNWNSEKNFQTHRILSEMQSCTGHTAAKKFQGSSAGRNVNSLTASVSRHQLLATPANQVPRREFSQEIVPFHANETAPSLPNQRLPGREQKLQLQCKNAFGGQQGADKRPPQHSNNALDAWPLNSVKGKGQKEKQKFQASVDIITHRLEALSIGLGNKEQEQHALVPYRGETAIVPFDPIKKRKPRPKVDIDPETDRLWKLLMGKEGSEGAEPIEKDKEKRWDEEREVFRGRVDSFIARMHLVQGDRRFSPWKGSVVDSVIGVFLTQNVSDHLSSSAFMSLAARFPLKSRNKSVSVQEPDIQIIEPNDNIRWQEKIMRQPMYNPISVILQQSPENGRNFISARQGTTDGHNRTPEEDIVFSQDSFDSLTSQAADEIRSSSGSNSEAEDQTNYVASKNPRSAPEYPCEPEKAGVFHGLCVNDRSLLPNEGFLSIHHEMRKPEYKEQNPIPKSTHAMHESFSPSKFQFKFTPGEDSISSVYSNATGISEAYQTSNRHQNEMLSFQSSSQSKYPSRHSTHQESFHPGPQIGNSQQYTKNHEKESFKNFQQERAPRTEITENAQANFKDQANSSVEPTGGGGSNISKARKGTADKEKNTFDWDSLRRQVQPNGERKERSQNAMDSMDYEALRRADVKQISDSIRERGMNNMLAERMKDFLNRLVRDHGSIDLEWLRDVPPDKAKDYLLNIRGLGLKSVECVRLLTLHHLAFPVDTNVGRIAVRLGWVPLQPLPESLQLHLLEMYPLLESIQKYLWPRLCKLDQKTLYELHYQMITFGKVFCTKSKPNCNACPMRAECRHFASAFASARLALPGPEEKGIVSYDGHSAAGKNPARVTDPMLLLSFDNNYHKESLARKCEPIIEEPKTPEPESSDISIKDIEEQYYGGYGAEDDEIPTIQLNMEEFTTNLQNMVQDNMELQGDMSKALVALTPEKASIPAPKLKNISRLRTEHHVYQLPDEHPLLEGFDKREKDDPSPYLLAIWTPGETANSTQPPEGTCNAQESGKLCHEKTCFRCNSVREESKQTVRGTILIPCRTAMGGSFPLNGTYFQVNEMFADHASSVEPVDVPRAWLWNLPRRTVYFGTSVTTIFKGMTTEAIQYCFWRGFVCVRGFDRSMGAPKPLMARLHFPASRAAKEKKESNNGQP